MQEVLGVYLQDLQLSGTVDERTGMSRAGPAGRHPTSPLTKGLIASQVRSYKKPVARMAASYRVVWFKVGRVVDYGAGSALFVHSDLSAQVVQPAQPGELCPRRCASPKPTNSTIRNITGMMKSSTILRLRAP